MRLSLPPVYATTTIYDAATLGAPNNLFKGKPRFEFFPTHIPMWHPATHNAFALCIMDHAKQDVIAIAVPDGTIPDKQTYTEILELSWVICPDERMINLDMLGLKIQARTWHNQFTLFAQDPPLSTVTDILYPAFPPDYKLLPTSTLLPLNKTTIFSCASRDVQRVPPKLTFFATIFNLYVFPDSGTHWQPLLSDLIFAREPLIAASHDKARLYIVHDNNNNHEFSIFLTTEPFPWRATTWKVIAGTPFVPGTTKNLIVSNRGDFAAVVTSSRIYVFDEHGKVIKNIQLDNRSPELLPCEFLYQDGQDFIVVTYRDKLVIYTLFTTEPYEIFLGETTLSHDRTLVNISFYFANSVVFSYFNKHGKFKVMFYQLPLNEIIKHLPKYVRQPSELKPSLEFIADPRSVSPLLGAATAATAADRTSLTASPVLGAAVHSSAPASPHPDDYFTTQGAPGSAPRTPRESGEYLLTGSTANSPARPTPAAAAAPIVLPPGTKPAIPPKPSEAVVRRLLPRRPGTKQSPFAFSGTKGTDEA